MGKTHPRTCPCCGYISLNVGPGGFALCPVCNWEDDPVQQADPDYEGGANGLSLRQAQERYLNGYRRQNYTPKFIQDPAWQPLVEE
ncbi:CPCC family cysteine-rich protein [Marinicella meishanensis]|uniref:CPCC family cysteine-rich protein n=1 Tax=Marinicella meishanensis TaxID=2873263 RepID=UPI001CC0A45B|nr:CPCC family cysteine-rich protein [Marinicella sp. NBU2979]